MKARIILMSLVMLLSLNTYGKSSLVENDMLYVEDFSPVTFATLEEKMEELVQSANRIEILSMKRQLFNLAGIIPSLLLHNKMSMDHYVSKLRLTLEDNSIEILTCIAGTLKTKSGISKINRISFKDKSYEATKDFAVVVFNDCKNKNVELKNSFIFHLIDDLGASYAEGSGLSTRKTIE